jgi:DNA-binding NarL/FixJ family response regulator
MQQARRSQSSSVKEGIVMANHNYRSAPAVRVLVVEDFEPFRLFIRSMLSKRTDLQIVCEVSDGLEAVCKAEELQPDSVLLDIGLPSLNGLAVAQRIRTRSPESKIIFVSQESDPAIVQEAFNVGAKGYVVKTSATTDLPAALDAVLGSRQFVSGGLTLPEPTMQAQTVSD